MARPEEYDVIVVGGGPAGSTVSTLVARRGHRVLLLEKERFPRYQIGESLLPVTVHGVCRLLEVTEELEKARFVTKRGGSFRWGTNPRPWNFLFALSPELSGPTSYAYQVERMRFDDILLRNARAHGVTVRENAPVTDVIADADRVNGVHYTAADGSRAATARYVIDASGNRGIIHRNVSGPRTYSDFFKNVAVFGYFTGGGRLPEPDAGNILCAAFDEGWIWYIPLTTELTSIGAVVNRSRANRLRGGREAALRGFIDACPIVRDLLGDARNATTAPYDTIRVRKDYSYSADRFWRPGMALIGDAACFIDPVFSTGVHLATYAGLLAARSVNSVLDHTVTEQRAFTEFEDRYRREYQVFVDFLTAFYNMQANERSYFWAARTATRAPTSPAQAFTTLIGGAASRDTALTNAAALTEAVTRTGPMQTETGERMNHLFAVPVVNAVMREMNHIQTRGLLGTAATEPPLLPDGLIPSSDGLSWTRP